MNYNSEFSQHKDRDIIDNNIKSRHSVRAFLPTKVPKELILEILDVAAHAPSGINTQPWCVHVVTGAKKRALSEELISIYTNTEAAKEHSEEYSYYPAEWVEPYLSRRREVGAGLYGLLGLKKDEKEKMQAQHARNFLFFDAPVGIFFTMERVMQQGSMVDYGMFLQNVMLAAKARGLDTCPQAAFNQFHKIVSKHLNIDENELLICAMSMGFADHTKIENSLVTDRVPAQNFTRFIE